MITGASSGIGAALARHAASNGWAVLAVARRADRLETLAREIRERGGTATVLVADVLAGTTPQAILESALQTFGRIDV
ncbi:MAG: SDR family NAD(P)-dependent oxidoreductase, partial [Candidatus Aquilonibacter sp.]